MDRNIFGPYDVAGETRWADPLQTHIRLLQATRGKLGQLLENAQSPDDGLSLPALEELLRATYQAFNLPAFDPLTGTGTLAEEARELLVEFLAWLEKKRVNTAPSPTSAPPTEPVSSAAP